MPYKIQHLGLGGILDQAIAIVKDNFGMLFSIMLWLVVPYELVTGFLELSLSPQLPPNPTAEDFLRIQQAQQDNALPLALLNMTGIVYGLILLPLANASITRAIAQLYLGRPITASEAIKQGMRRLVPLIGTTILFGLALMAGFIMLVVPMVLFMLWFGLYQQVVVIEEIAGAAALGRSKKLVRPFLGTYLLLGLVLCVMLLIYVPALFIPQPHLQLVAVSLISAVTTLIWTAAGVVFYFSCRCALENFDLHLLAENIAQEPALADDFAAGPRTM